MPLVRAHHMSGPGHDLVDVLHGYSQQKLIAALILRGFQYFVIEERISHVCRSHLNGTEFSLESRVAVKPWLSEP